MSATRFSEPSPRYGHFSSLVEDNLFLWGGQGVEEKVDVSNVHRYDPNTEAWSSNGCERPPPGSIGGACASAGHHIYTYGGCDAAGQDHGTLHGLDTMSWMWSQLSSDGPMKKWGCSMIAYGCKMLLFGGICVPSGPIQPGSDFVADTEIDDGSNELHVFDLKEGTWSSPGPQITGTRPPPGCHFSLTKVDDNHVVLFGGGQTGGRETNDLYILDLNIMDWSKLEIQGESCPVGRALHAAVCLGYGGDHPQLLVTGGRNNNATVLRDVWLLDLQSGRWREVTVPTLKRRKRHSATAFSLSPGLTEVIIFGGVDEDCTDFANTTVLRFEYQQCSSPGGALTGEWVLTDVADNTQLGTKERIRSKDPSSPYQPQCYQ